MKKKRALQPTVALLLMVLMMSCTRQPPDRTNLIQLPLFGLVLVAPVLSLVLKRKDSGLEVVILILQVVAYVVYETGVSVVRDNRADLVLMYPAIGINAWIVFGDLGSPAAPGIDDVAPGVSVPLGNVKCDACGTTYPSRQHLHEDQSGGKVCDRCLRAS